jgi:hypothetical protein
MLGPRGFPPPTKSLAGGRTFRRPPASGLLLPPGFNSPVAPRPPGQLGPFNKIPLPGLPTTSPIPPSLPKNSLGALKPFARQLFKQTPFGRALSLLDLLMLFAENGLPEQGGSGGVSVPKFAKVNDCTGPGVGGDALGWLANAFNICGSHTSSGNSLGAPVPATNTRIHVISINTQPNPFAPHLTHKTHSVWDRQTSGPTAVETPQPVPFIDPFFLPQPLPSLDPLSIPIGRPIPVPRPLPFKLLPYRQPNPFRSPTEQTEFGNEVPSRAPFAFPDVVFQPFTITFPDARPPLPFGLVQPVPRLGTPPSFAVAPAIQFFPPPVRNVATPAVAPPSPGERERKGALQAGLARLAAFAYAVTEGLDVLDVLHDALPEQCQVPDGTPQEKALALYNCLDQLDLDAAIKGLILNAIEDAIVGRANQLGQDAADDLGLILGPAI